MKTDPMPGMPPAPKSEPAEADDLNDAMSDLGEALADKDWGSAAAAFRRAVTICGSDEADTTEE